ncbi:hypothetical protein ACIQ8D_08445 [Streptomyces sp. NPDC096094]|uniref:SGM_3592 family protein n=1 Tax=Streptomyces sp. NPDC096094 TaxID=3366073 RepID=UPI0038053B2F
MAGQTPRRDGRGQPEDGAGNAAGHGTTDNAGDDTWDGLVLDEEFVRDADTSEPSARARMLAARWRREKPEPQPWRSDEPPAGWFFSKARRRRWRRR